MEKLSDESFLLLPGWEVSFIHHGVMTIVLIEEDRRWLITAAHNTDVVSISVP